jgi:hypothetical protein
MTSSRYCCFELVTMLRMRSNKPIGLGERVSRARRSPLSGLPFLLHAAVLLLGAA